MSTTPAADATPAPTTTTTTTTSTTPTATPKATASVPTASPITLNVKSVKTSTSGPKINIASVGCVHGELDAMYMACHEHQQRSGEEIHIVICCGDFESLRNYNDLQCLAAPPKYRDMIDFYKYYNGKRIAPILTLFTHGNHEASNYLMELPYGGWVAPHVYFMGFTNVVSFFGITIAAVGGIFKQSYKLSRYESCPMDESDIRSLYHTREVDTWMMSQYSRPVDIIISHDWPTIVTQGKNGDVNSLTTLKPLFKADIQKNELGSPHHTKLMQKLRPLYWFSAHLHCKYPALVTHDTTATIKTAKDLTKTNNEVIVPTNQHTKFLGLDKIIPGRHFMHVFTHPIGPSSLVKTVPHVIEVLPSSADSKTPKPSSNISLLLDNFSYDPYWIDILKSTQPLYPRSRGSQLCIRTPTEYHIDNDADVEKKKTQHGAFYQQFSGSMCSCIRDSTNQNDLYISQEAMLKALYPDAVYNEGSYQVPAFSFQQTALPILSHQPPPKNQQNQLKKGYNKNNFNHKNQRQLGHQPIIADLPEFQVNPQTVLFCNHFQLLVPIFSQQTQWCSPKHAAELCLAHKKPKAAE